MVKQLAKGGGGLSAARLLPIHAIEVDVDGYRGSREQVEPTGGGLLRRVKGGGVLAQVPANRSHLLLPT